MLKVENISTGYGKKQILFDVSFKVSKGEIVLLVGSNGSGKSTLLKAIYGLLPNWNADILESEAKQSPVKGKVIFNNEDITGKATSKLLKKGLLYIPQKNNLFEDLTVKENLEMAGLTLNQKLLKQRIENALSIFIALVPHLNRTPMKLSGGERSLLSLAMATLHQPIMILIDEPFTGLSPKNITFVSENLKVLNEKYNITLMIVEHRVKESSRIANRVISLKLGKVFNNLEIDTNFNINQLNSVFI
ncbi:MAG TPA: ATP-binding cassette domain-containing protein [Ignavibacteriaceae bacterium]|nr:ATP-binding cassette domain-containing protein [Ignavibacteriaceae bacterium]